EFFYQQPARYRSSGLPVSDGRIHLGRSDLYPDTFNSDKSKLFFFLSHEWGRQKTPPAPVRVMVPTAAERQGDFSNSRDAAGVPVTRSRLDFSSSKASNTRAPSGHTMPTFTSLAIPRTLEIPAGPSPTRCSEISNGTSNSARL